MDKSSWRKQTETGTFLISTSSTLLNHDFINAAFGTEEMYWAKPLPPDDLATLLTNSITLGLYEIIPAFPPPSSVDAPESPRTPSPTVQQDPSESETTVQQIGLARFITDQVTTAYLTDVYVEAAHRGQGHFHWLMACAREVIDAHPALRRVMLVADPGAGAESYKKQLGVWDVREESEHLALLTRRAFKLDDKH